MVPFGFSIAPGVCDRASLVASRWTLSIIVYDLDLTVFAGFELHVHGADFTVATRALGRFLDGLSFYACRFDTLGLVDLPRPLDVVTRCIVAACRLSLALSTRCVFTRRHPRL